MSEEIAAVRRIAWRTVFPWLLLFRTFRLSISLPILFLATVGAFLTPVGWSLSQFLFVPSDEGRDGYFLSQVQDNSRWPDRAAVDPSLSPDLPVTPAVWLRQFPVALQSVPQVYLRFVDPFWRMPHQDSMQRFAYYLFGGLWNIAVWSFLAGAITRIAAVQLGREERVSLGESLKHARRYFGWYLLSPLFPLLGVALTLVPIFLVGLLMRFSVGLFVAGLLWPFVLLGGFVMAVLLLGLMFGWPLMWPTISSEKNCDAFEAFSRSYSYTFQRPLQYLAYTGLSVVFGGLCWLLVASFSDGVIGLAHWGASLGAGESVFAEGAEIERSEVAPGGSVLIQFSNQVVRTIAAGFNYSFFFCSATGIYLLLRREVDQAEFDEVFVEDEEHRYGLPEWQPGEEVAKVVPTAEPDGNEVPDDVP